MLTHSHSLSVRSAQEPQGPELSSPDTSQAEYPSAGGRQLGGEQTTEPTHGTGPGTQKPEADPPCGAQATTCHPQPSAPRPCPPRHTWSTWAATRPSAKQPAKQPSACRLRGRPRTPGPTPRQDGISTLLSPGADRAPTTPARPGPGSPPMRGHRQGPPEGQNPPMVTMVTSIPQGRPAPG